MTGSSVMGEHCPLDQIPSFACPDQLDGDLRAWPIVVIRSSSKESCLTARQELRPAVDELPFLETSQRLRGASSIRYLLKRSSKDSQYDGALSAPRGPGGNRNIAERQRRSPAHRDLLQLPACEKPEPLAVG